MSMVGEKDIPYNAFVKIFGFSIHSTSMLNYIDS